MFARTSHIGIAMASCLSFVLFASSSSTAAILSGSGPHLPIPAPNPAWPPGIALTRTPVAGGFTGTWTAPAHTSWIGTFNATGPIPNNTSAGTTNYDFSTLPNGHLPAGTFFLFGDFDGGSTTVEQLDLRAWDSGGSALSLWLNDTLVVTGTGLGSGGTILPTDMPGWNYNVATDTYRIDGTTVTGGNPSVAFSLVSNQAITRMQIVKTSTFNGFGLRAPQVPEPSALTLSLSGLLGLLPRRRNG